MKRFRLPNPLTPIGWLFVACATFWTGVGMLLARCAA